jgi:hypothetical protein
MPEKLATLWCNVMHDSAMWPIHEQYECRTCGRHYPVPWNGREQSVRYVAADLRAPAHAVGGER